MNAAFLRETELRAWAFAFVLTQIVEVPIWMRAHRGSKLARLVKAFGATAITHPLLWFVFAPRWRGDYWSMFVVGELLVVAVESTYARLLGAAHPLAWSAVANATSASVGLAVYYGLGWM